MGEFPMPGLTELRDKYTYLGSELSNAASLAGMLPPSPQRKSNLIVFNESSAFHNSALAVNHQHVPWGIISAIFKTPAAPAV